MQLLRKYWSSIILIISICVFVSSVWVNAPYFHALTTQNILFYELRQFASLVVLFVIGFLFLKLIQTKFSSAWTYLLAFPSGIALYVFAGQLFLLFDFTMRIWRVFILIGIFLGILYLIRKLRHIPMKMEPISINAICLFLAGAFLVSSGFIYIVTNYDSYFYFSIYGKTLAKYMCYKDFLSNDAYVLTNIGQFLPIISSYNATWKLDTMFPIHVLMLLNFICAFSYAIYAKVITHTTVTKARIYTACFIIMLVSCSPFFLFSNWLLSNSWILFYLFFLFVLALHREQETLTYSPDYAFLICGYSLAITMLRKDGLLIVCFFFVSLCIEQFIHRYLATGRQVRFRDRLASSWQLALLFLPSLGYMLGYVYVLKHILYATVITASGSSLLSDKTNLLFYAGFATLLYLVILHRAAELLCRRFLPYLVGIGLLGLIGMYALKDLDHFLDYLDSWFRNFAGISFGYSIFLILGLITCILLLSKHMDGQLLFTIGYIFFIIALYFNKGNMETDIDNSGLRAMYQIIPEIFLLAAWKLAPHLLNNSVKDTQ